MTARQERGLILFVVAATLVYHAATIDAQAFFVDELSELRIAREPIGELLFKADSMPPLYPLLNRGWLALFGDDGAARWLSVLFTTVAILACWRFVRTLVDPATGVAAAAIFAASPLTLFYAQFVRAYALVGMLAVLTLGFFALAVRSGKERRHLCWAGFIASAIAGAYTHYYYALLLASLAIVHLVATRGRIGREPLIAFAIVAIGSGPVAIFLESDFGFQKHLREARGMSPSAVGYSYFAFASGYTLGPSKSELHTLSARDALIDSAPWAIVGGVSAIALLTCGFRRLRSSGLAWPTLAMATLPVLMTGGLGAAAGITYNTRFVAWCVAPASVLVGAGVVEAGRHRYLMLAVLGLATLGAVAVWNRQTSWRYANEDFRSAARFIAQSDAADLPIFCVSDYTSLAVRYYLPTEGRVVELPSDGELSRVIRGEAEVQASLATVDAAAVGYDSWLVYSRAFHGDPEGLLISTLAGAGRLEETREFAGVKLYRLRATQPAGDDSGLGESAP